MTKTVAEVMTTQGLTNSNAVARVAILEKRVTINDRLVTHQETPWPKKSGTYIIHLYEKGKVASSAIINQ